MKLFFLIMCGLLLTFGNCSSTKKNNSKKVKYNFCKLIDSLVDENKSSNSTYFANRILPILEKESGIEARCDKGFIGYIYISDSLFDSDVEKWRKYFNCK